MQLCMQHMLAVGGLPPDLVVKHGIEIAEECQVMVARIWIPCGGEAVVVRMHVALR